MKNAQKKLTPREIANHLFENTSFPGINIVDSDGWEALNEREFSKVFYYVPGDSPDGEEESSRGYFSVNFSEDGRRFLEAAALDERGQLLCPDIFEKDLKKYGIALKREESDQENTSSPEM